MDREARKKAVEDMMADLEREHKSFIAFRRDLNPVMNDLEHDYLHAQRHLVDIERPKVIRVNGQLMAHFYFCVTTQSVRCKNYLTYYQKS